MAAVERITLNYTSGTTISPSDMENSLPGLRISRISVRSTTSSLSDYPEWRMDELRERYLDALITDGTCS